MSIKQLSDTYNNTSSSIKLLTNVIAFVVAAVTAIITIDGRYAHQVDTDTDIKKVKLELSQAIELMHKQVLDDERLRIELGNNIDATRILLERNKRRLSDVEAELSITRQHLAMSKAMIVSTSPEPPTVTAVDRDVDDTPRAASAPVQ